MTEMELRGLGPQDLAEAAQLHRTAFPGFFLSALGEPFLREFYRGFLNDGAITVVARAEGGRLLGTVVGHIEPRGFFRRLVLRRWYAFAFLSLGLAVRRPHVVPRLLRALTYRGQTPLSVDGALLSSICVSPASQGQGVGHRLLEKWMDSACARGVRSAYLLTDAADNEAANAFYISAGWAVAGSYQTPEGRKMTCYAWSVAAK